MEWNRQRLLKYHNIKKARGHNIRDVSSTWKQELFERKIIAAHQGQLLLLLLFVGSAGLKLIAINSRLKPKILYIN